DLAADAVWRELAGEAGKDALGDAHLAVLADGEDHPVDGIGRAAALVDADLGVEEAALDVELLELRRELDRLDVGRLAELERVGEDLAIEGAVAVEDRHEARPGLEVDVEVAPRAQVAERVAHL